MPEILELDFINYVKQFLCFLTIQEEKVLSFRKTKYIY
jgi:hypothetical protein